jgi:hypothetical protein
VSDLVIGHGNPWWLSPDVWVVPAANPTEPSPGEASPVVGDQYLATATVQNTAAGGGTVNGVVYFYWADPSLSITPTNAHQIGFSNITLNPGQTGNTQCTTPWVPALLSDGSGHECLVAAVVEEPAPGQVPPPPANLDGNNDPTVAQHNLGVITVSPMMEHRFVYSFEVFNGAGVGRDFQIATVQAPLAEAKPFLQRVTDVGRILAQEGKVQDLGLVAIARPQRTHLQAARPVVERLTLQPRLGRWMSVTGTLEGSAALMHVTQELDGKVVGGLSILAIAEELRLPIGRPTKRLAE